MVDRPAVALGAVARESFPHRQHRLALHHRLADRFAVALTNEPDRLAIRRPFFPIWLTVLAVALLVDRAGRRFTCFGIRRGRARRRGGRIFTRGRRWWRDRLADAGRRGWLAAGANLVGHGDPFSCSICCLDHWAGQTGEDGIDAFHLALQCFDSGVVGDNYIGPPTFKVIRPLGSFASL